MKKFLIFLFASLLMACRPNEATVLKYEQYDIVWETDLQIALIESEMQHKPILLYVNMEGCQACEKLDSLFNKEDISETVNRRFIPLKLNNDKLSVNVSHFPAIFFVMNGKEILHMTGLPSKEKLIVILDDIYNIAHVIDEENIKEMPSNYKSISR